MKISLVTDKTSWKIPHLKKLTQQIRKLKHHVRLIHDIKNIPHGDISFFIGLTKIVPPSILARNKINLVVHESDAPKGRGWSPLSWQVLRGKTKIPITIFEAKERIDSGRIFLKSVIKLKGTELIEDLRKLSIHQEMEMCIKFLKKYPRIVHEAKSQKGKPTYFRRRTPEDSQLNLNKSLGSQFNLLRIVDNDRYPAHFYFRKNKYILKIHKEK
jgi:methionyl-tRNA formyltransferase